MGRYILEQPGVGFTVSRGSNTIAVYARDGRGDILVGDTKRIDAGSLWPRPAAFDDRRKNRIFDSDKSGPICVWGATEYSVARQLILTL